MKALFIPVIFFIITINAFGQEFQRPAEGKSLVYFTRYGGALALIDFRYFDGQKYLGRVGGNNYFIYECDPGEHVFWVSAENNAFIKGNLKPNSTYVIEVRPYARVVMDRYKKNESKVVRLNPDWTF